MPFPRWLARFNRRFTNRFMIRLASLPPWAALTHVGRRSGTEHRIPINAFPHGDGFVIALTYGSGSDWVRNVVAAGGCRIEYRGRAIELAHPELVGRPEAWASVPWYFRVFLRVLRVHEFLRLRRG